MITEASLEHRKAKRRPLARSSAPFGTKACIPRDKAIPARLRLRLSPSDANLGWEGPARGQVIRAFQEDKVLSHSDPATGLPVGPRTKPEKGGATGLDGQSSEALLALVLKSLDDDKAEDIVQIDLRGRSDVADYMVICSGRSSRQVAAISEKLADRLKQEMQHAVRMEGKETGDWVLIDAGDVIVHVFRPEVREFYRLEEMWLPSGAHRTAEA